MQAPTLSMEPKFIHIDRSQLRWGEIDVESLIEADHPARAIWCLISRLDLSSLENNGRSVKGKAGAPRHAPQLLVSVWIYAYSQGIASARAIERMMGYEPGLRWLCGDQAVNHHTLSDFRVGNLEQLRGLFTEVLGVMAEEQLLDLTTLMQDGTKMQAVASKHSFHRRPTLERHLAEAQAVVQQMEQQSANQQEQEAEDQQRSKRKQRRAEQHVDRMKQALEELARRESNTRPSEQDKLRVSESEPEARVMLQSNGGWAPSYNVQMTTETKSKLVVNVDAVQAVNDQGQLIPALEQAIEQCRMLNEDEGTAEMPQRMVTDGGYTSRENVEEAAQHQVQLISPWKEDELRSRGGQTRNAIDPEYAASKFQQVEGEDALRCPAGRQLVQIRQRRHHDLPVKIYESNAAECSVCEQRQRCLRPEQTTRQIERVVESEVMKQYLALQQEESTKELYKRRKAVAEFPQLHFKGRWNIRSFIVRGLEKVKKEVIWIAMAYNVTRWMLLRAKTVAQAA
jgi:transposase